jgi:hypothetical protein
MDNSRFQLELELEKVNQGPVRDSSQETRFQWETRDSREKNAESPQREQQLEKSPDTVSMI